MADKQVRARVSEEVAAHIDSIVSDINKKVPEANVNVSSILRYALDEYRRRYDAKQHNTKVFLELPTNIPNEDLSKLFDYVTAIMKIYKNVKHPIPGAFNKTIEELGELRLVLADKSDQPNNDREVYEEKMNELYKDAPKGE